jgi:hypothetical protein
MSHPALTICNSVILKYYLDEFLLQRINDISDSVHTSRYLFFADDLKVFCSINNVRDCYIL